jgi:Type IIA topoisomerase (DNA gyrase/topo II, topoisomerase IV), A subunit
LVGLAIAVANIDEVIALIRRSPDPNTAREGLMARDWPARDVEALIKLIDEPGHQIAEDGTYRLSDAQARAILELRLQRLTGLERDKIAAELEELAKAILDLLEILDSRERRQLIMRTELAEIKAEFATPRKTTLEEIEFEHDVEALIQQEDMVVTVTHGGYIKRVPLAAYRAQRRGGKGRSGMATREEDFVNQVFVADTHRPVLFFSTRGMVYKIKVYRLPLGTPQARGKALVNLLPLQEGEKISTVLPLPADEASWEATDVMFATASGDVRRNKLSDFINVMANGKIAMKLEEGDRLIGVSACTDANDVLLALRGGRCIRFRGQRCPGLQQPEFHRASAVSGWPRATRSSPSASCTTWMPIPPSARPICAMPAPSAAPRARKRASPMARSGKHRRAWTSSGPMRNSSSPSRPMAMASAPRPMNTASPTGAGRASPISRAPSATAMSSPPSPVEDQDQIMLVTDGGPADPLPGP